MQSGTFAQGHGLVLSQGWWQHARITLPAAVGWPMYLAGVAGLGGLRQSRRRRLQLGRRRGDRRHDVADHRLEFVGKLAQPRLAAFFRAPQRQVRQHRRADQDEENDEADAKPDLACQLDIGNKLESAFLRTIRISQ